MEYKNITIEKQDVNFTAQRNPVMVTLDFDFMKALGRAVIYKEDNVIKAYIRIHKNLKLVKDLAGKKLYPIIGYSHISNTIYQISLSEHPNQDSTILPIIFPKIT